WKMGNISARAGLSLVLKYSMAASNVAERVGRLPAWASINSLSSLVMKTAKLTPASLLSQASVTEKECEPDQAPRLPAEPVGATAKPRLPATVDAAGSL